MKLRTAVVLLAAMLACESAKAETIPPKPAIQKSFDEFARRINPVQQIREAMHRRRVQQTLRRINEFIADESPRFRYAPADTLSFTIPTYMSPSRTAPSVPWTYHLLPYMESGDRLMRPKHFIAPGDFKVGTSNTILFGDGSVRTIREADFNAAKAWFDFAVDEPARTTTFRQDDRFTTRYQEGSLIITLTGSVADGKAKVGAIKVQDGKVEHRFAEMDKIPAEYRDKVRALVGVSEKGEGKLDVKRP